MIRLITIGIVIYFIIAIFVFFCLTVKDFIDSNWREPKNYIDNKDFTDFICMPLFWIITIPILMIYIGFRYMLLKVLKKVKKYKEN